MSDKSDADKYREAQAMEILLRFKEAHGRDAVSDAELTAWVRMQGWDKPVVPRDALLIMG